MTDDVLEREWKLLSIADSAARTVLDSTGSSAAYDALSSWSRSDLLDDPELPHVGEVYSAWAELADLYELGRSTPEQFHSVARVAAGAWLARPSLQSSGWLEQWVADTRRAVAAQFERDGTTLDGKPF